MNLNVFDNIDGLVISRQTAPNLKNDALSEEVSSGLPENASLAMAYVPFQQWNNVYTMDEALNKGTLFPDLEFPFERGGIRK